MLNANLIKLNQLRELNGVEIFSKQVYSNLDKNKRIF